MFEMQQKVLFKHCDPAGIVFFPRYFEMMNDCVEAFFDQVLGTPFETLLLTHGVPTAAISTRFTAPSRHGDLLVLKLQTTKVGRTSWQYQLTATCNGTSRFETEATIVHVDAAGKTTPWPDTLHHKLKTSEARHVP